MPEINERDVKALAAELGLLGKLTVTILGNKHEVFTLATDESVEDIIAICSFILDPSDLNITEETPSGRRCPRARAVYCGASES